MYAFVYLWTWVQILELSFAYLSGSYNSSSFSYSGLEDYLDACMHEYEHTHITSLEF